MNDEWDDDRQLAVASALGRIESHIDGARSGAITSAAALGEIEHTMRQLYARLGMQWHASTHEHRSLRDE